MTGNDLLLSVTEYNSDTQGTLKRSYQRDKYKGHSLKKHTLLIK